MKYFRLDLRDADRAKLEVWGRQREAQAELALFHVRAAGLDTSIWTEDTNGEALFRLVLDFLHIPYEEGDEQQVQATGFGIERGVSNEYGKSGTIEDLV